MISESAWCDKSTVAPCAWTGLLHWSHVSGKHGGWVGEGDETGLEVSKIMALFIGGSPFVFPPKLLTLPVSGLAQHVSPWGEAKTVEDVWKLANGIPAWHSADDAIHERGECEVRIANVTVCLLSGADPGAGA